MIIYLCTQASKNDFESLCVEKTVLKDRVATLGMKRIELHNYAGFETCQVHTSNLERRNKMRKSFDRQIYGHRQLLYGHVFATLAASKW